MALNIENKQEKKRDVCSVQCAVCIMCIYVKIFDAETLLNSKRKMTNETIVQKYQRPSKTMKIVWMYHKWL